SLCGVWANERECRQRRVTNSRIWVIRRDGQCGNHQLTLRLCQSQSSSREATNCRTRIAKTVNKVRERDVGNAAGIDSAILNQCLSRRSPQFGMFGIGVSNA